MSDGSSLPRNLVLIGLMGSGKTTIGRELHLRLGYPLVDMDQLIERRAGKPIPMALIDRLKALAAASLAQVCRGLDALATSDADLARTVIAGDPPIDGQGQAILKELKLAIRREPERVNTWLRLINTARNLERAADHATNIAEAVIYIREGTIYRRAETVDG